MAVVTKRAWRDYYATRTPIIGTDRVVYSAWRLDHGLAANHSTITHLDPEHPAWFGRVGTEKTPLRIDLIQDRACRTHEYAVWRRATYELAYEIILGAFPELAEKWLYEQTVGPRARREDGQIVEYLK